MSGLTPQLVIDKETGKLCMQVKLGPFTATATLPDDFRKWNAIERSDYIEKIVPEMITELHSMRRTDQRKLRRKLG